jgi:nucleotide-binding universal stress UspA family protein
MLKSLAVVLTDAERDRPALLAASALARSQGAHLEVVCLDVMAADNFVGLEMGSIALESDQVLARGRAEALKGWAQTLLPPDQPATVTSAAIPAFDLLGAMSRFVRPVDLVVGARPYGARHGRFSASIAEAVLFACGAPLLVLPDADATDWGQPLRRLGLAWNDSNEAMRAARAALPFLRSAQEVEVVTIGPMTLARDGESSASRLMRWLRLHEVEARLTVLDRGERRKAEGLVRFAVEQGCQALVMGAYGHSRLREALLGGTTRAMLTEVPLPLLMAH